MQDAKLFASWVERYKEDPDYILHGLLLEVTEKICAAVEEQGLSRAELAKRLGVKPQYVTNFLNTPHNTTLRTIVRFAQALDLDVALELRSETEAVRTWSQPAPDRRKWQSRAPQGVPALKMLPEKEVALDDGSREAAT